jgi:hypothetical protein
MTDLDAIRRRCDGMLPPDVYRRVYDTALGNPGSVFVEVGTALAAATLCLAGKAGVVHSFEKLTGGSRERYGDAAANRRAIEANIAHFGLTDRVAMHYGDVRDTAAEVPADAAVTLLMLDADGRLDRDFRLFFDRLPVGADIIIDDMRDLVKIRRVGGSLLNPMLRTDQKHVLTLRLVDLFTAAGLIEGERIRDTWFGRKRDARLADLDPAAIAGVYHTLVFADAPYGVLGRGPKARLKALLPEGLRARLRRRR